MGLGGYGFCEGFFFLPFSLFLYTSSICQLTGFCFFVFFWDQKNGKVERVEGVAVLNLLGGNCWDTLKLQQQHQTRKIKSDT